MKQSAGIFLYRRRQDGLQVLLIHPGGPFWAKRDAGGWSMPKGEYEPDEDPQAAARREFQEELGVPAPTGEFVALGDARTSGGKVVTSYASLAFQASSYQPMQGAGCMSPSDCWFAGNS